MDDRDRGGARPSTVPRQPRRAAGPVTAPRHSAVPVDAPVAAAPAGALATARAAMARTGAIGPVARAALPNLMAAAFAATAGLGVTWLVARTLGPASAGGFFAAVAAFVLATGAARLGTTTGLVYWVARFRARGRPDLADACLRVGLGPVTLAAIVLALALWITAPWLGPDGGEGALRVLALFLPAASLTDAMLAATRGYRLMRPTIALDKLLRPALQLTGVAALAVAALWTSIPPGAWPLVWALPYLPAALLAGYALRTAAGHATAAPGSAPPSSDPPRRLGMGLDTGASKPIPNLEATHPDDGLRGGAAGQRQSHPASRESEHAAGRGWGHADRWDRAGSSADVQGRAAVRAEVRGHFWRFTGPRAVASVLQLALQRLDILLVAALAGPAAAAVYTVAGRFVVLGQLVNQATGYPVAPRLAERLSTGDLAGAGALYRTVTAWLVLTTWPLYLLVIGHAPLYLGIFGDAYRDAAPVVVVLAAAMLLATACGPVDMVLAMAGRTRWNLLNVGIALTAMVAVDLVLIPRLGALGAAVGLAVAVAANNLLPLAQVWYALRLHPFGRATLAAAALTTVTFGLLPAALRAVT